MGSVRRSNWRSFLPYLLLNAIVSAGVVLLVLYLWNRRPTAPTLTPTPTINLSTEIAILKPTVTATLRPSPTPNVFTVQPGDTLFGIAQEVDVPINALMAANGLTNPDQLSVGQILLIPSEEWIAAFQERQPTVRARASITPSPVVEPHAVEIRGVEAPGDLDREAITIENRGGVVDMRDWRMSDGEGNTYTFPAFTLHRGAFNLNIKEGNDTPIDLYWNLEESILTPGKTLTLSDADGKVVSTFTIPE